MPLEAALVTTLLAVWSVVVRTPLVADCEPSGSVISSVPPTLRVIAEPETTRPFAPLLVRTRRLPADTVVLANDWLLDPPLLPVSRRLPPAKPIPCVAVRMSVPVVDCEKSRRRAPWRTCTLLSRAKLLALPVSVRVPAPTLFRPPLAFTTRVSKARPPNVVLVLSKPTYRPPRFRVPLMLMLPPRGPPPEREPNPPNPALIARYSAPATFASVSDRGAETTWFPDSRPSLIVTGTKEPETKAPPPDVQDHVPAPCFTIARPPPLVPPLIAVGIKRLVPVLMPSR